MCEGFKLDGLLVADATHGCAPEHSHEVLGDDRVVSEFVLRQRVLASHQRVDAIVVLIQHVGLVHHTVGVFVYRVQNEGKELLRIVLTGRKHVIIDRINDFFEFFWPNHLVLGRIVLRRAHK